MLSKNINFNLYKDFYIVCKYGSINKAAINTGTTPPAISKSIKKLEQELNRKLFYRNTDGMKLTKDGEKLRFYVEKSYNNLLVAERELLEEDSLKKGKLTIGIPSNIGSFLLFDDLMEFHNNYKNIEITLITGSTQKLIELLETHTVDFVIDTEPINIELSKNYVIKELEEVDYCFVCSKEYDELCNVKNIKDLEKLQLILPIKGTANRNDLDELFIKNNIKPQNILNLHTSEMIISAVKNNIGVGYVIKNLVENDSNLQILNLKEKLPTVKIDLVYNKNYLTMTPKRFINMYIDKSIK